MNIKKNDFIKIEFTGRISDSNEIFDTNIKEDAKEAGLKTENLSAPIICVGSRMLPEGFDEDLIGKEENKDYEIELEAEKAFGKRNPKLVQMIPTKLFHEQNINPVRGMQLTLDGQLVRVLSSDHGRTLVDFNSPLSGKKVKYNYNIKEKINDEKEKVNAIQDFIFRQKFNFEIKDKKLIFNIPKEAEEVVKAFSPKFEEMLNLKVEVKIKEETKKETKKK